MGRTRESRPSVFVAKESFTTEYDGQEVVVRAGRTHVAAGHPIMRGRESLFEPLTIDFPVETATANPGETREQTALA